ncbi:unnamed protein product [Rotaria sordida]|uniref:Metalloendopeptidase n=1 Tax=Rotaria sordida TaxID=392033 RepID=A0A813Y581_9BILA|nr:unnamed protein product [Rotaria sordida]
MLASDGTLVGYSTNFQNGHTAGAHIGCRITKKMRDNFYLHNCDMGRGASGGPIFAWWDNTPYIYALNVAEYRNDGSVFQHSPEEAGAFEGDIILPPQTRGVGEKPAAARWTNGIVPYVFKAGDFDAGKIAIIVGAMRRLEQSVAINNKLCVQFRPATAADKQFITIKDGAGCTSSVGMNWRGVKELTLGQGCVHEGTIMHEMLHCLGFWHEQSRPDRDNYVTVLYANVQKGLEHAFNKYTTTVDTMAFPYDYDSLLHYGTNYFSANGKPTLVPKDPSAKIGQRNVLSATDILEVQRYYQCTGPNVG